ncbi:hypothetical protein, conserved [Leishmania tarentolae]|uniref:Uncharacterized protein n=1 Tax=Leishmania tarentolae TaxID=5689 RepID=A0A640KSH6_LEITA|nr:hypothetical protein, conserved [Leishmania tarentolae]
MELQEVDHLLEELTALLSQESVREDAVVAPAVLNAVADYVEGIDSTGAGLDQLRQVLEVAVGGGDNPANQRMKAAGRSRAIQLLRDATRHA